MNCKIISCLFIIVSLVIVSCTDKGIVSQASDQEKIPTLPAELTGDKLAQYLVDLGFRPDMIELEDEGYLVEGDIYFSRNRLLKEIDQFYKRKSHQEDQLPGIQQWATSHVVNINNVDDIVIRVASGVPSSWATAVNRAVSEWSSINDSRVHITVNNSVSNPDIIISMVSGERYIARASWPGEGQAGQPGPRIYINSDYNYFSSNQKQYAIAHELGHCIGLRHTNWQSVDNPPDAENAIRLRFTFNTDDNSVMNGNTGGNNWNGFSTYDRYGVQVMYPSSLGGMIENIQEGQRDDEFDQGTFYVVVTYSVTGGKFQASWLQKKVNGVWQNFSEFDYDRVSNDEFWIENERLDTMHGTEIRVRYRNFAGDVVAYSPSETVSMY